MESKHEGDSMTREEAAAFIGTNASFYLDKWELHSEDALKGWNWATLFFGIEWMAYRKMYVEALLTFVIFTVITSFAAGLIGYVNGSAWILRILLGALGNVLYQKKALRVHRKIKINIENDSERLEELSRRGGVNNTAIVVVLILKLVADIYIYLL